MSVGGKKVFNEAVEAASLYTRAELDHFKLRLARAISVWASRVFTGFIAILSLILVLIFLGLAGALYLQRHLTPEGAYLCVALFYALIGLLFMLFRKQLIEPLVLKSTLSELFDES